MREVFVEDELGAVGLAARVGEAGVGRGLNVADFRTIDPVILEILRLGGDGGALAAAGEDAALHGRGRSGEGRAGAVDETGRVEAGAGIAGAAGDGVGEIQALVVQFEKGLARGDADGEFVREIAGEDGAVGRARVLAIDVVRIDGAGERHAGEERRGVGRARGRIDRDAEVGAGLPVGELGLKCDAGLRVELVGERRRERVALRRGVAVVAVEIAVGSDEAVGELGVRVAEATGGIDLDAAGVERAVFEAHAVARRDEERLAGDVVDRAAGAARGGEDGIGTFHDLDALDGERVDVALRDVVEAIDGGAINLEAADGDAV